MKPGTVLRVARPSSDLDLTTRMYRDGLGLEQLGSFVDHDGFDGVMLGHAGQGWHLEFTHRRGHEAESWPDPDDLIVFYLPERGEWQAACARMLAAGFEVATSYNPYWDRAGSTFVDPDGHRIVLQNAEWRR